MAPAQAPEGPGRVDTVPAGGWAARGSGRARGPVGGRSSGIGEERRACRPGRARARVQRPELPGPRSRPVTVRSTQLVDGHGLDPADEVRAPTKTWGYLVMARTRGPPPQDSTLERAQNIASKVCAPLPWKGGQCADLTHPLRAVAEPATNLGIVKALAGQAEDAALNGPKAGIYRHRFTSSRMVRLATRRRLVGQSLLVRMPVAEARKAGPVEGAVGLPQCEQLALDRGPGHLARTASRQGPP